MANFVGREDELLLLERALERAGQGSGSFVLVHGPMGIGKSRLMAEFASRSRAITNAVTGRWYESSEVPGDTGFAEALLPLIASAGAELTSDTFLRELARLGPEFAAALRVEGSSLPSTAPEERYRLWRGVVALLECATRSTPALLLLDDLQWCDEPGLELLAFVAGQLHRLPVLVVGTTRDEDQGRSRSLNATLLQIGRSEGYQRVLLSGLSLQQAGSLVSELWDEAPSGACLDGLFDRTRGNPLFLQELARHAVEQRADPAQMEGSDEAALPATLQTLVEDRLLHLSKECRRLLSIAAAVGHDCDVSLLQQIAGATTAQLASLLEEALRAGVLHESSKGVLSFGHPIMRSAIYQGLSPLDRLDLHLEIAKALEGQHPSDRVAREVARHLIAAGSRAEETAVVTYCLTAARQARAAFAFVEARQLADAGLQACPTDAAVDRKVRAALLAERGYAAMALGQPDDALASYRDALATCEELGDDAGATDVRRWMAATLMHYGRWQETLEITSVGLERTEEQKTDAYLGLVGNHALALLLTGRIGEMKPWVDRQVKLAFDRTTRAGAHHTAAGWHSWGFGEPTEANEHFLHARRLFLEEGLQATAAQVALDHACASYFLGRLGQANEALAEAERLAEASARGAVLADIHAYRSMMHVHRGEWQEAEAERERWREILERIGGTTNYSHFARSGLAFEIWSKQGPAGAAAVLDPEFLLSPPLLARLKMDLDPAQSCAVLEPLHKAIPANGRGLLWLAVLLPVAQSFAAIQPDANEAYYEALCRYRSGLFDWNVVDIELGRIAASAGRWGDAERHFADAQAFCETHGLRPFLGIVHYARGVAWLQGGGPRRRALASLDEAMLLFQSLGMDYAVSKVQLVRVAPRRGRPPAAGPHGLTPREMTVLKLVAEGWSTKEIAGQIVVAERTVEHHVGRIYVKLGVSNRAAAIAWALNHGLVDNTVRSN